MIKLLTKFRIPASILFFISLFTWSNSGITLLELEELTLTGWLGFVFFTGFWLSIMLDMIILGIHNKTFWLISMLIMPWLAPVMYLFQRKKVLKPRSTSFLAGKQGTGI